MDLSLKELIGLISQGGVAVIVFIIWYFTFIKANKQTEKFLTQSLSQSADAFKKHIELNAQLIQLLKEEQEYKIMLTGVLDRISIKLDVPTQCPILVVGKKMKMDKDYDG